MPLPEIIYLTVELRMLRIKRNIGFFIQTYFCNGQLVNTNTSSLYETINKLTSSNQN